MLSLPFEFLNGWLFGINANRVKEVLRECYRVLWQTFQAEQQIELEKRVTNHDSGFDKAIEVFKGLDYRVSELESWVSPQSLITESHAAEIQLAVKAAAKYLSSKDSYRNHFQSIFQELYRHFRVSSYKNIRVRDYEAVLTFLRNMAEQK